MAPPTSLFAVLRARVRHDGVDEAVLRRALGERGSLRRATLLGLLCQDYCVVNARCAHAVEAVRPISAQALGFRLGVSLEGVGDRILLDEGADLLPAPRAAAGAAVRHIKKGVALLVR